MHRVITVLKQRGSDHESALRELFLTKSGPKIGSAFAGLSGVSGGATTGHYQSTIDDLMQPLTFIKNFAEQLSMGMVPEEKQDLLYKKISEQSDKMIINICDRYGLDKDEIMGLK